MNTTLNNEQLLNRKKLINIIPTLNNTELIEIFNIIKQYNCPYTENKNGIFINLSNVDDDIIDNIFKLIEYLNTKNKELIIKEELIEQHRTNIKKDTVYDNQLLTHITEYINDFSDDDEEIKKDECIFLDDDLEETNIKLKKKKNKYTGIKAKIIKNLSNKDKKDDNQIDD